MAPEDDDQAPEARPPVLEDLVALCRALNAEGARYVVIGGMAVIQAGLGRTLWRTKDTVRDKDKMDRAFLARLLADRGEGPDSP